MPAAPSGTITFLFTDIEGSTRLWQNDQGAMSAALAGHDAILRETAESCAGYVFKTIGDAFCISFPTAHAAVEVALAAQQHFHGARAQTETAAATPDAGKHAGENDGARADALSLRVRMALHTGSAELRDGDYFGPALNRVSRLLSAAHGGQTLLSLATAELVRDQLPAGASLRDLGEWRLKDLHRPERIFQLTAPGLTADFPPLHSLEEVPNNLPEQLTSFVGREREMAEVTRLLAGARLLTLLGPGGTGKTRLSLQVAAEVLDKFPDGVRFAELATISDPDLVPAAVADVLDVREEPGQALPATLAGFLRGRTVLLILDNCEHVIYACAQLAEGLLRACPQLRILASSREPLGIAGETRYAVPSLSLPDIWREKVGGPDAAERLTQFEAVRLFIDRAVAVRPAFQVTNENAPHVAEICARLDGIPLAIELAAARVKVLTVQQIAQRLGDRFRLLTGGSRTAMPRQQALRALIDWSYDLLAEPERVLFRRLAVFGRGRTLDAVESVCAGDGVEEWEILDLLTQLVDKSLVSVERTPRREPRYTMLESVWDYAREKLAESGELDMVRARHLDFFTGFAEKAEPELAGRSYAVWVERCDEELMNFRFALRASLELPGAVEKGMRLLSALQRYAEVRSLLHETHDVLEQLLTHRDAAARTASRARALAAAARIAWISDRIEPGARYAAEALAIYREIGDPRGTAEMLGEVALFRWDAGDIAGATQMLDEADALAGTHADKRLRADLLQARAVVKSAVANHREALALSERGLALYEEVGDEWSADGTRWTAGVSALLLGEHDKARVQFERALHTSSSLGSHWALPYSLEAFAALAVAGQQYERAARLLGAAEALRAAAGLATEPADYPGLRELLASAAEQLNSPELRSARREGRALTGPAAVACALERSDAG